jgi:hypothetical protein
MENPRDTAFENPCSGATVIVEVPAAVALTLRLDGLAVREKSWTVTENVVKREFVVVLEPVTVTV